MSGGGPVHLETVDVTDVSAVRRALASSVARMGPVAHVFHSAGVLTVGAAEAVEPAAYRRMIEVNYLGSVHVAQAVLPHLKEAPGRSTLTFVASVAGLRGFPQLAGYAASKFAVVGFAEASPTSWRARGCRSRYFVRRPAIPRWCARSVCSHPSTDSPRCSPRLRWPMGSSGSWTDPGCSRWWTDGARPSTPYRAGPRV